MKKLILISFLTPLFCNSQTYSCLNSEYIITKDKNSISLIGTPYRQLCPIQLIKRGNYFVNSTKHQTNCLNGKFPKDEIKFIFKDNTFIYKGIDKDLKECSILKIQN